MLTITELACFDKIVTTCVLMDMSGCGSRKVPLKTINATILGDSFPVDGVSAVWFFVPFQDKLRNEFHDPKKVKIHHLAGRPLDGGSGLRVGGAGNLLCRQHGGIGYRPCHLGPGQRRRSRQRSPGVPEPVDL